jgi:hypothetical protein
MVNLESAKLVLRLSDASLTDQFLTNFTWTNINLRTVLGPMYDKYDLFNIYLTNIMTVNTTNNYGSSVWDLSVSIFMSGLPFVNQTYNCAELCNGSSAVITNFIFNQTADQIINYNTLFGSTFGKSNTVVNINIFYQRALAAGGTYTINAGGEIYPAMAFTFIIYGIPKDPGNNNGTRLIM